MYIGAKQIVFYLLIKNLVKRYFFKLGGTIAEFRKKFGALEGKSPQGFSNA